MDNLKRKRSFNKYSNSYQSLINPKKHNNNQQICRVHSKDDNRGTSGSTGDPDISLYKMVNTVVLTLGLTGECCVLPREINKKPLLMMAM